VRAAVLLTFEEEARDTTEDVQPGAGVAANLDLRSGRAERVKRLLEQVAHDGALRLVAVRAHVANGQVFVDAHVALDETCHVPGMPLAIVAFEDQQVTPAGGATIALAFAFLVGMGQRGADLGAQRNVIAWIGRPNAIRGRRVVLLALHHRSSRPTA
jgi:hypothetical protein